MEVGRRLPSVIAVLTIAYAAVAAAAHAQGGRLVPTSTEPIAAKFEKAKSRVTSELAFTVRNDSDYRGALRVRLVFDDGTTIRLRKKHREIETDDQTFDVWLTRRGSAPRIGPRDVKRIKVQLRATEQPKTALGGTLVVATRRPGRVSSATLPVTLAAPAAAKALWHEADVEPPTVVVKVHRWLPTPIAPRWLITDAQDVRVEDLGTGADIKAGDLVVEPVAADTGGRGSITISAPHGVQPAEHKATIRADARRLTRHGTYEATVPLDEGDEKSAKLTVKVVAADLFIWPLLVLLLGALLAYRQLKDAEQERPKRILRLALTKLQKSHVDDHKDKDSPQPYDLDVFPSDWEDCQDPEKEAHKLYCRIGEADLGEELEDIQKEIADLDARVRLWSVSRAKVAALIEAREKLPDDAMAKAIREKSEELEHLDEAPKTEKATKAYHDEIDAQIKAIETWIVAHAMFETATEIHDHLIEKQEVDLEILRRHNPRRWQEDLMNAATPADLERCGVLDALCRDVHVLRSLDLTPPAATTGNLLEGVIMFETEAVFEGEELGRIPLPPGAMRALMRRPGAERAVRPEPVTPTAVTPELPTGPSHVEPSPSISAALLDGLKAGDTRNFWWAFVVATIAYFVGIYSDTFGSPIEYLTAFAAGAGSMYVANYKLLPWFRSYRPPTK